LPRFQAARPEVLGDHCAHGQPQALQVLGTGPLVASERQQGAAGGVLQARFA